MKKQKTLQPKIQVGDVVKSRCYGDTEFQVIKVFEKLLVLENLKNGFHYTLASNIFYLDAVATRNNDYINEALENISNRSKETKYLTRDEMRTLIGFLGIDAIKSAKTMLERKLID